MLLKISVTINVISLVVLHSKKDCRKWTPIWRRAKHLSATEVYRWLLWVTSGSDVNADDGQPREREDECG